MNMWITTLSTHLANLAKDVKALTKFGIVEKGGRERLGAPRIHAYWTRYICYIIILVSIPIYTRALAI